MCLLADGERRVRIQGDEIRVAARVRSLDTYSGHADAKGLTSWAAARRPIGGKVFICHGEPSASQGLAARLADAGLPGESLVLPSIDDAFALEPRAARSVAVPKLRPAPERPSELDWHNARAALLGDLDARLEAAATDAERTALLETVRRALAAVG